MNDAEVEEVMKFLNLLTNTGSEFDKNSPEERFKQHRSLDKEEFRGKNIKIKQQKSKNVKKKVFTWNYCDQKCPKNHKNM